MTDHDRGAYTPQADAPLAFDARSARDRRPMPMTLAASGTVLMVILGALFLAYRGGVRGGAETPRPVGEPLGAIKTAAASPSGSGSGLGSASPPAASDAPANLDVYAAQNVPEAKPTFAPPPEQPARRSPPSEPAKLRVQAVALPPVRIEAPEAPAASTTAASTANARTAIRPGAADRTPDRTAVRAAPAPVVASAPDSSTQIAARTPTVSLRSTAPIREPAGATVAKAKAAPLDSAPLHSAPVDSAPVDSAPVDSAPVAAPSGGSAVQIGAFSSRALADKGYADVAGAMAGAMGGKGRHVEPLERGGKTMFRTTVTGFPDHASARTFCEALSAKGHPCFVKG